MRSRVRLATETGSIAGDIIVAGCSMTGDAGIMADCGDAGIMADCGDAGIMAGCGDACRTDACRIGCGDACGEGCIDCAAVLARTVCSWCINWSFIRCEITD